MAGRTADISTSSFKPLSLDEIMTVPLAKQKAEDQANLALDEFAALEQNSLDVDKGYVSGQIQSFQKEADALANQIATTGVDRNLINKTRALRNRKNQELSIHGKTGQASAAFNEFKANEKLIMADTTLSPQQKQLGLAKAKSDYTGVLEGGKFQAYIGNPQQDLVKRSIDIMGKMTPEQKAGSLGLTKNAQGLWTDGTYAYEKLTPEHISQVTYQALKADKAIMDYVNELESLDPSISADKMLRDAALASGNVGQVSKESSKQTLLPASTQGLLIDPTKGRIDTTQPWTTMTVPNQEGLWDHSYNMPSLEAAEDLFVDGKILDNQGDYDAKRAAKLDKERSNLDKLFTPGTKAHASALAAWSVRNEDENRAEGMKRDLRESLSNLRESFPVLAGVNPETNKEYSDKEIFEMYMNGAKKASLSYSQVVKPANPSSTFVELGKELVGSGERNGTFASKNMKIAGGIAGGSDLIAEQMGLTQIEFNTMVRTTGRVIGFAPGHVDMPGAFAVQVELPAGSDDEGGNRIIYMQNDGAAKNILGSVSRMNEAVKTGKNFETKPQGRNAKGETVTEHIFTELNPSSKSYEAAIIRSTKEFTRDEISQMVFKRDNTNPTIQVGFDQEGNKIVPPVMRWDYDDELQRASNAASNYYDKIPDQKQTLSKAQKNG